MKISVKKYVQKNKCKYSVKINEPLKNPLCSLLYPIINSVSASIISNGTFFKVNSTKCNKTP